MFNNILKILIFLNYLNIYSFYIITKCGIVDNNYNHNNIKINNYYDKYLDLIPKTVTLKLPDERVCSICKLKINVKLTIPENCTIQLGCPYNKKTKN
mgnify:FL=1|jgi:hypothetical protein